MTAERPGTPGVGWERELRRYAEVVVEQDDGDPFGWADDKPQPNRATRRAVRRATGSAHPQADTDTGTHPKGPQAGAQPFETEENH